MNHLPPVILQSLGFTEVLDVSTDGEGVVHGVAFSPFDEIGNALTLYRSYSTRRVESLGCSQRLLLNAE